MKITIKLREGGNGRDEELICNKATRYEWPIDGSRFSVNLPNRRKFTTTSANVVYMIKEEDDDEGK